MSYLIKIPLTKIHNKRLHVKLMVGPAAVLNAIESHSQ